MPAHLNHLVVQDRLAGLARSAERERLVRSARPAGSRRSRGAWRVRLLAGRRLGVLGGAKARRAGSVRSTAH
jgi:hypothetical protein